MQYKIILPFIQLLL